MPVKHEIERKFLVVDDGWKASVVAVRQLRDGLVAVFGSGKVRVRIEDDRATVTLKGPRQGIVRSEYEYPVPLAEAEAMLAELCEGRVVEKTRHLVPHAGLVWEIDVYRGLLQGVIHAEVEIDDPAQPVILPSWVGAEVTGVPEHGKRAMVAARRAALAAAAGHEAALR